MRRARPVLFIGFVIGPLLLAAQAEALSITIVPGSSLFIAQFGSAAGPVSQERFLAEVSAAADYWEGSLMDERALRVEVGWSSRLGSSILATETDNGVDPFALIAFSTAVPWFVDPTPFDASEFADESILFQDLGGGLVNTSIKFGGATGDAQGRFDLFSIALHEIGHALGLSLLFQESHGNAPIVVTDPLPFAGSAIPYANGHLAGRDLPLSLMQPFSDPSQRLLPSDVDILAVAQAGGFTQVQLNNLTPVPEPAASALMLSGVLVLVGRRLRRG